MGEHKDVSLGVFILVALFGMSSWLGVNSIWMELPLTVVRLPELWALPSYLAVILQVANIGAVILTVVNTVKPGSLKAQPIIYGILIIQIVATFCVALFWQRTTVIGGEDHSTALFILMFFIAICNTTSNIVFLPFMARYRHEYITALFVGMGLSALLPSVVALVQGGGTSSNCVNVSSPLANNGSEWSLQTPMASTRFGVDMFYTIITGLLCVSFLSFVLLTCLPRLRRHQLPRGGPPPSPPRALTDAEEETVALRQGSPPPAEKEVEMRAAAAAKMGGGVSAVTYGGLLLLEAWICALMHGALPSVQAYACMPYGSRALHLSITLSNIANPIACFVPLWFSARRPAALAAQAVAGTAVSAYIMMLASTSPTPPLHESVAGEVLVIGAWIVVTGLFSYLKVCIAGIFRSEGKRALFWCGVATQAGSALGALILFPLINTAQVFTMADSC